LAGKEHLVVDDAAWDLLRDQATQLRSITYQSGTMLDVAGNGRYARKLTVACRRERARRTSNNSPRPIRAESQRRGHAARAGRSTAGRGNVTRREPRSE